MDDKEILKTKVLSDGRNYSVRFDRHRYFFPKEWEQFVSTITNEEHKLFFVTLMHTGARAMEALNVRVQDFDFVRNTIDLRTTKQRVARSDFESISNHRQFVVSKKYLRQVKAYIKENNLKHGQLLFLNNSKLPENYYLLSNIEKKKYYKVTENAYYQLFRRKLKIAGIKDWKNFGLQNIKKTYANWMRVTGIKIEELCYNVGDDMRTFYNHYGSAIIFTEDEKIDIRNFFS